MLSKAGQTIFYGNYFIALCVVALSVETNFQLQIPLNQAPYYFLIFTGTVVYYTYAYMGSGNTGTFYNERSAWYGRNIKTVRFTQNFYTVASILLAVYLVVKNFSGILHLLPQQWGFILLFPLVALLYYGIVLSPGLRFRLRRPGWLKPFVIGFVWAGIVTLYPVIFKEAETKIYSGPDFLQGWLFMKNLIFITVLCIMFDIKDYAADHNQRLKTFVVRMGLRKTIFFIIIPLTLAGFAAFIIFAIAGRFPVLRIAINTIPFLFLILVAYSLHLRKPILYYLAVIDGLMLVKAVCGILGILLVG